MGLLSNRLNRNDLKPGDHIYTWRTLYTNAHHGIYVGDDKVIHFTNQQGSGTALSSFTSSSVSSSSGVRCSICTLPKAAHNVVLSCLNHFLDGDDLFRFEYGVTVAHFQAQIRGGTCTVDVSDPDDIVVYRAYYLLNNGGFGCYNVLKNNCEDFAFYCKTELYVLDKNSMVGQSGQAVTFFASAFSIWQRPLTHFLLRNRKSVKKVAVEDLARWLATG